MPTGGQPDVPATQLNTAPAFGGKCHLDANMVATAIPALPLEEIELLIIENVGDLVCSGELRVTARTPGASSAR